MATALSCALPNRCGVDSGEARPRRLVRARARTGVRRAGCSRGKAKGAGRGIMSRCALSAGIVVLMLQWTLATGDGSYEGSAFTSLPQHLPSAPGSSQPPTPVVPDEEVPLGDVRTHPPWASEDAREQPAFSSILTLVVGPGEGSPSVVDSALFSGVSGKDKGNQTNRWPSEGSSRDSEQLVIAAETSIIPSSSEGTTVAALTAAATPSLSSTGEAAVAVAERGPALVSTGTPKPVETTTAATATQPTPRADTDSPLELTTTTTAAAIATHTELTRTAAPSADTLTRSTGLEGTTAAATEATAFEEITTATPEMTSTLVSSSIAGQTTANATSLRTTVSLYNATTETPVLQCRVTEEMWVKTVLSVHVRGKRLDGALRQNVPRGLSQALQKAFNLSSVHVQVENVTGTWNVTVAYYVVSGSVVYAAPAVVMALTAYGSDRLLDDVKQFVPLVQSIPLPVAPWWPTPDISLQVKTVLRFVGPGDDIASCAFTQSMEQRLESAFAEAQAKVLNSSTRLSVQVLGASQSRGSQATSLIYVVRNGSSSLNGTVSSNLLNQLSAELVGYFLFYPPLSIAEPLVYHNLNTSIATRDYWVITVLQYVDNSSLEGSYKSFARLMEQRLAELFVVAHQQGARFRRATTVDGYTVQMVSMRRVPGPKNPAEMTYYVQHHGSPLPGHSAAKILNTVDSQTMALTLGYFVQVQAEPVVKRPPSNLWIIPAVLAPIGVVTVIVIIITAVLCRRNKADFKADLNHRSKTSYRREASFYHQPVQGFDYAKQHLGQQGGDEDTLPAKQETVVLPLPIRDGPLSHQNGTGSKKTLSSEVHRRLPSEDGSVISSESGKPASCRGSSVQRVPAQQKTPREEASKRSDPYDSSSGSMHLVPVQPAAAPPNCSHPASLDRSHDSTALNGEVNMALKQKSDIERYRNKLRLKAKQRGHCDLAASDSSGRSRSQGLSHQRAPLDPSQASTYVKSSTRCSQLRNPAYRSRQSLSSPSPGGTEMDLLVMGDRAGRGIRNTGYDTEPELIEETNIDHLMGLMGYAGGLPVKGHSESSTLSSQPSIDEVRQQMHLLLDEAFTLASSGRSSGGGRPLGPCRPPSPGSEAVTSAPGSMARPCGELHWTPPYGLDLFPCSLPQPAFRFTQLPDMAVAAPPPPVPPRTGPLPGTSLRRSTSDIAPKARSLECSMPDMHNVYDSVCVPVTRSPLPGATVDQHLPNYSAVYAIPATRACCSGYSAATPPTSYRSPSWMSYPPEPEDLPRQWAGSNQCHLETIC
ncbi:UPF0606 protein KIAA1549L-like isoform X2 [Scleropages formosus]|uniref:UPF0606 protein KIAA1549L-like isoform X2 n=1 Tax=Scleropages formosus TaxID=113540 RepID=UPI0010FA680C|nr:UPF0606 protein KIAA1549L-like isoform X2 [Scleropages formosus]